VSQAQSITERMSELWTPPAPEDGFHTPAALDYNWTETCWFSLVIPDRKISIQTYPFFQTNLDVCSAGVYIWDDTGHEYWNCRYFKNFWHLPFPKQPLHDLYLPNGLRYKALEPLRKYEITYDCPDGQDVHFQLVWDALTEPNRAPSGNHLDQPGRISGTLVLDGETIEANGVGFRDRTWSPRSQFGRAFGPFDTVGYTWGISMHSNYGFFLLTASDDGMEYGLRDALIFRDGEVVQVKQATRRMTQRDPIDGFVSRVTLDMVDETNESYHIEGTAINRLALSLYPNLFAWSYQRRWTMQGLEFFGGDHDNWGMHAFRHYLRRLRLA
jgi:hypothetical protein